MIARIKNIENDPIASALTNQRKPSHYFRIILQPSCACPRHCCLHDFLFESRIYFKDGDRLHEKGCAKGTNLQFLDLGADYLQNSFHQGKDSGKQMQTDPANRGNQITK